jgi:hypothetical protein
MAVRAVAVEFDAACVPQGTKPIFLILKSKIAQGDLAF